MKLQFTKMQGIGNDFVVFDATEQEINITSCLAKKIADRRYGIGCDQILLVENTSNPDVLFRYRIFNADGSEVSQCGNGARCFARFVADKGLCNETAIPVETASGKMVLYLEDSGLVRVNMGPPRLEPAEIPFLAAARSTLYVLDVAGQHVELGAVSMGNPHGVLLVDNVDTADVEGLGPALERHPDFPARANIGFMQVISPNHIRLRVYERGAGETLACGSGACAAVVSGRLRALLSDTVKVDLPGGQLMISWSGDAEPVFMTGPADTVFEGTIEL